MPVKRKFAPRDDAAHRGIGLRLRQVRKQAGVSAEDIARPLGHTPQWLYEIEGGRSALLLADAIRIAKICQAPLENLAHPQATPSIFRQPITMEDWRAMYRDDEARANAHFSLDRLFNNTAAVVSDEPRLTSRA